MTKRTLYILTLVFLVIIMFPYPVSASLILVEKGSSDYKIIIAESAGDIDKKAATVLQKYLQQISGVNLAIENDTYPSTPFEIRIGKTNRRSTINYNRIDADGFCIDVSGKTITLTGGKRKGVLYSVYAFLEQYLGCRKYTEDAAYIPEQKTINIPSGIHLVENPAFVYREVYYPPSADEEYLDWHKLHRLDDMWGLWVHTFDKLVPSKKYFTQHPEYYALVDGVRRPTQLCLSNPGVFDILTANLRSKIADDPGKQYWSVSQNDDIGYCECHLCKAVDKREGGPQGSILQFVNRVGALFPDKTISTLAYAYSRKAPLTLKPAANVNVMFCSIECNRSKPIETDPRSASFRKDLKDWSKLTNNIFVWDYVVQFTNYVSPFPNFHVLQPNIQFFIKNGATGLFEQGSDATAGEFSEMRAYLLAKLSWNPAENVDALTQEFLAYYYGKGAPYIKTYMRLMHSSSAASQRVLDIYGTPVREYNSYLTPELIEKYGIQFDKAEAAVENDPARLKHVRAARLPVEYAVLQQSKFYGIDRHGLFVQNDAGEWVSKQGFRQKVNAFVNTCNASGIHLLSETGMTLNQYREEWEDVFKAGPKIHQALGATVTPVIPFSVEYPNKGAHTLTDGSRGYTDFQYNWLGWYGDDMEVVVDMVKLISVHEVHISFLEDQRHWIFLPSEIKVSISDDGKNYRHAGKIANGYPDENYKASVNDFKIVFEEAVKTRYIKLTAANLEKLPIWRYYKGKKAWLFAAEIMVM